MPKDTTTAQIVIEARDLCRTLRFALQARVRFNTIPILGCLLFEFKNDRLHITGTDLDIECVASCEATSERIETARFVMDGRQLLAFASMASGLIHIGVEKDALTVAADDVVMTRRNLLPPEDWPTFVRPEKMDSLYVGEVELWTALRSVLPTISTEETRYYLNGVFFTAHPETKALRLVSTDGHRMGIYDLYQGFEAEPCIVPRKVATILQRAIRKDGNDKVMVSMGGLKAEFQTPAGIIRAKMIDGTYPDYTRVLPKEEERIAFTVGAAMVRRLMVISSERSRAIEFYPQEARVTCRSADMGEIAMPMQFTMAGDPSAEFKPFGINGKYLLDHCGAAGGPIRISGSSHDNPFTIKSDDPRALWVQMPMRV